MIYNIFAELNKKGYDNSEIKNHIKKINNNSKLVMKLLELEFENKLFISSDKITNDCIAFNNNQYTQCKRCRIPNEDYCKVHIKHVKYDKQNEIPLPDFGRADCPRIKYNFKTNKPIKIKNWNGTCVESDKHKHVENVLNSIKSFPPGAIKKIINELYNWK